MGCQTSQLIRSGPEIKISIVDSTFMKVENEQLRREMKESNITFEYFISLECFFDEFKKRYYNKVVTTFDNYSEMKTKLQKMRLTPNMYVVLEGRKLSELSPSYVTTVQSYFDLIKYLRSHAHSSMKSNQAIATQSYQTRVNLKVLCKPGVRTSQQTIFQAALNKACISYEFYNSFQLLQQSLIQSQCLFVVTDYIFHGEVVELFKDTKTRVICYCSFEKGEHYSPDLYSVSNNYLDITSDMKNQIKSQLKHTVKCSKVYLYSQGLADEHQIISTLSQFDIEVRTVSNLQKIIKETSYFFCVTVISVQSESKNIAKYMERNDYLERVKILSIPSGTQPSVKGLFKLIRNIKKGYKVTKAVTNSIDIIDKHYNSTKFEEIKRELQSNDIKCFGFSDLSQYIKNKKFISPFIICNYEERLLLLKYMKQLQCKAKIIVFCNKNKISLELKDNKNFAFVSSHFGKIIKFIKKTQVYIPAVDKEEELLFKQKIEKIKTKNKRISALKWSRINGQNGQTENNNFEFLNISKDTNHGSIRDIQKTIAIIWKTDDSILEFEKFKSSFINSLKELRKIHKINFQQNQFNTLIQKIKVAPIHQILEKVKTFFDADNELGLEINKSLMKTESLDQKQITNMRQFLLFVFLNFFSGYHIPRISQKKLTRWISTPIIQKCQIGSYLFCKHFTIFYQDSALKLNQIGKFKIQLDLEYNTLTEEDLLLNSFFSYKDKIIFTPFSQFEVKNIFDNGQYKTVTIKFIKNVDFLKYIYADNLLKSGQSIADFAQQLVNTENKLVDSTNKEDFTSNISRIKSIELFRKGAMDEAIKIHKKLIQESEVRQNLDSALINELNFELVCFYFKANKNREAAAAIKELIQSDPGPFIREECEKMIEEAVDVNKENQNIIRKRKVSEQAMKTFVWLKNKQQSQKSESSEEQNSQEDEEGQIFENELKCIEVGDIGEDE